jgi:hypothetical protein
MSCSASSFSFFWRRAQGVEPSMPCVSAGANVRPEPLSRPPPADTTRRGLAQMISLCSDGENVRYKKAVRSPRQVGSPPVNADPPLTPQSKSVSIACVG